MDGFGLAQWVRRERPWLKVILTSGAARTAKEAGDLCEQGPVLAKPYDHAELERTSAACWRAERARVLHAHQQRLTLRNAAAASRRVGHSCPAHLRDRLLRALLRVRSYLCDASFRPEASRPCPPASIGHDGSTGGLPWTRQGTASTRPTRRSFSPPSTAGSSARWRRCVKEFDHADRWPAEIVEQMKELGLFGATVGAGVRRARPAGHDLRRDRHAASPRSGWRSPASSTRT